MGISSREWAEAFLMIQQLQQKCDILNGMFGDLTHTLSQSGVSTDLLVTLEKNWNERWKNELEEISVKQEDRYLVTDAGVQKGKATITLEDMFEDMLSEVVEQMKSDRED